MKHRILYTLFLATLIALGYGNSGGRASQAGDGNTGAPGESQVCANCHSGGSMTVAAAISLQDADGQPVAQYTPGEQYALTVSVDVTAGAAAAYGFQLVGLRNSDQATLDGFSEGAANVKFAQAMGRNYAEHNGVLSVPTFEMQWTAPAEGTGDVTLYAAVTGVNGNGQNSGDAGDNTSLTLSENTTSSVPPVAGLEAMTVLGNPVRSGDIRLAVTTTRPIIGRVALVSMYGHVVATRQVQLGTGSSTLTLPARALPSGTYFVVLRGEEGVSTRRVVVE